MNIPSALRSTWRNMRNHGVMPAAYDITMRVINKCFYYKILQCVVIDEINQQCLALASHLRFAKLNQRELMTFAKDPANEMAPEFLEDALNKGDECYAILDSNALASYGWYSQHPTLVDEGDLTLQFDPAYVYMYKGFTLKAYRGQRLHAIGMTRALAEYKARGLKGLVSYMESNNFDSLKSCYRMGYRNCGRIRVIRIASSYLIRTDTECQSYGLTLYHSPCKQPGLTQEEAAP